MHNNLHNNLVYPLLRRFVENSWVAKRTTDGRCGQKRDLYALTAKGNSTCSSGFLVLPKKRRHPKMSFASAWACSPCSIETREKASSSSATAFSPGARPPPQPPHP